MLSIYSNESQEEKDHPINLSPPDTYFRKYDTYIQPKTMATTSRQPRDPASLTEPVDPSFPLTDNDLQDLLHYSTSTFGQIALKSSVQRPRGTYLCSVTTQFSIPSPTWSSFQTSKTTHAEFNNALVYMNHSCTPSVEIHVCEPEDAGDCENGPHGSGGENNDRYPRGVSGDVYVAHDRDLNIGDEINFFYPSTEWDAHRIFKCICGSGQGEVGKKRCLEVFEGSKALSEKALGIYFVNKHVLELAGERDGK